MGTDIHSVFQRQLPDGSWQDIYTHYEDNRHYTLFGILAGVRDREHPRFSINGIPKDFTIEDDGTHNNKWMGDHTFSHLTGEELLRWFNRQAPPDLKEETEYFFEIVRHLQNKYNKIRIVFGFDS